MGSDSDALISREVVLAVLDRHRVNYTLNDRQLTLTDHDRVFALDEEVTPRFAVRLAHRLNIAPDEFWHPERYAVGGRA